VAGQPGGAAGNDELLQFAANPKVNASQVFHIVTSVLQGPLPSAVPTSCAP
jgi:hypothetical protein